MPNPHYKTFQIQIKKGHRLFPYCLLMCQNAKNMFNIIFELPSSKKPFIDYHFSGERGFIAIVFVESMKKERKKASPERESTEDYIAVLKEPYMRM